MEEVIKNISDSVLRSSNKELTKLLVKIVDTARGGNGNTRINNVTGKLRKTLKTILIRKNNKLVLNIDAVEYYQYLDTGSKNIKKPWFLTDTLTSDKRFIDILDRCIADGFQNTITKSLNN